MNEIAAFHIKRMYYKYKHVVPMYGNVSFNIELYFPVHSYICIYIFGFTYLHFVQTHLSFFLWITNMILKRMFKNFAFFYIKKSEGCQALSRSRYDKKYAIKAVHVCWVFWYSFILVTFNLIDVRKDIWISNIFCVPWI